jgi:DNA helicase-2/ATP-dependent DNA helicase PcrA
MIDEYQDTNRPQYELMKLLAAHGRTSASSAMKISRSIAGAARISSNILEFEKDFPRSKTIRLEQNYRSTQVILEGAGAVVRRTRSARARTCGPRARAGR